MNESIYIYPIKIYWWLYKYILYYLFSFVSNVPYNEKFSNSDLSSKWSALIIITCVDDDTSIMHVFAVRHEMPIQTMINKDIFSLFFQESCIRWAFR